MSESGAARLVGHLTRVLYEQIFDSPHAYRVGTETYELILVRRSDGKFFEAEISVIAWETSAEAREADRERITKARQQAARAKGRAS